MQPEKIIPILYTKDLDGSIAFYTALMGFTLNDVNNELNWASLTNGPIELMLSAPVDLDEQGTPSFTGSFYFRVKNINEWWTTIQDKATICYPLEVFDWGMQEFAIYDNNGYVLQFGEPVQ